MISPGVFIFVQWVTLLGTVLGHGGLNNYTVGDTWYRGYDPTSPRTEQESQPWMVQRLWASIDPLFSATDPHLSCNDPGTAPPSYIPIAAGQDLTAVYWFWLHPVGPMTVWLAPCVEPTPSSSSLSSFSSSPSTASSTPKDCRDVDPSQSKWFKIWEAGLLDAAGGLASGTWYQGWFQRWDGSPALWPVTIPARLRPGLYMIRHEILSIHVADKPQFYPECAHLNVTGSGSDFPPEGYWVTFPGAYEEDDPSIRIDIYSDELRDATNYTIPGGRVWEGFDFVVNRDCPDC